MSLGVTFNHRRFFLRLYGQNFRLISHDYKSALKLLEITEECEESQIRKAYLDKAKVYHPDSLSDAADAKQFAKVIESKHPFFAY